MNILIKNKSITILFKDIKEFFNIEKITILIKNYLITILSKDIKESFNIEKIIY